MSRREKTRLRSLVVRAMIVFFIICIPAWTIKACSEQIADTKEAQENGAQEQTQENLQLPVDEVLIALNDDASISTIGLEQYILGVVSAEMPASFHAEALKAQAVAARTFTVKKKNSGGCSRGGDICTDSAHCQAYQDEESQKRNWKGNFSYYRQKLTNAVAQTQGLIVTYDSQPIEALFHSTAGGMTEDSQNAFTSALPYLKSVRSDEVSAPKYEQEFTFTRKDASKILNSNGAKTSPNALHEQIVITSKFPSGRVDKITVGTQSFTGRNFRKLFSLPSTNFTIDYAKSEIKFTTKGYGHGVGLSQTGANDMAKNGDDFVRILTYYYTDTQVEPMV